MMSAATQISVKELDNIKKSGKPLYILDVRTEKERNLSHIGGLWIPINELPDRLDELDIDKEWIVYCHGGTRSQRAVDFLEDEGFKAKNLKGGIVAWQQEIDPNLPV